MEIAKIVKEIEKTANETEIQSDCLREQVTQICEWLSEIARKTGQYYLYPKEFFDEGKGDRISFLLLVGKSSPHDNGVFLTDKVNFNLSNVHSPYPLQHASRHALIFFVTELKSFLCGYLESMQTSLPILITATDVATDICNLLNKATEEIVSEEIVPEQSISNWEYFFTTLHSIPSSIRSLFRRIVLFFRSRL